MYQLLVIIARYRYAIVHGISGLIAIEWALFLFQHPLALRVDVLEWIDPDSEVTYPYLILVVAILHLVAIVTGYSTTSKIALGLATGMWVGVAAAYGLTHVISVGTFTYTALGLGCFITALDMAVTARGYRYDHQ